MEEEILIGPATAQEISRGAPIEGALENPLLKKRCLAQSATNAAKDASFLSGQQAKSRFTAAIALEKMTGLNQKAALLKMTWKSSTKSWIES